MNPLWLAPIYAVWLVTAAYWSRSQTPVFSRPGPAAEKFARVNLVAVAAEGVLSFAYALVTVITGNGNPLLGIAAGAAMFCAVDLYSVKLHSPSLWTYTATGRHSDPDARSRPTSRWPYTVAYTGGYILLFLFALTMGARLPPRILCRMTYPPLEPFDSGMLELDDGAQVYWEASGNLDGLPALWLHGGPGSGLGNGGYRRHFDPSRYVVVGIDQRGCGRSRPLVNEAPEALQSNTTGRLIADIEQLRQHIGIERWVLAGASWGTTLALAYALEHPDRVLGLVLLAVTTTGREEIDWITEGVGRIFPEAWQEFADASRREAGERVVEAYARRLASADPDDRAAAALAWDRWENAHASLDAPDMRGLPMHEDEADRLCFAMLVTHYWANDAFLPGPAAILARVAELGPIPAHLIHGRRDMSGPAITPWRLHKAWPSSTLHIVEDEGHGGPSEMELLDAALDRLAER